jgi:hypothetical protein
MALYSVPMAELGKTLVFLGIILSVIGLAMWGLGGLPLIGRLPGDIYIRRGSFTFYFPLTTCIVLSVIVTLVAMLFRR